MPATTAAQAPLPQASVSPAPRSYTRSRVSVSEVRFRTLSEHDIRRYIATGEPMDKAGAYGIQGLGCLLVKRIEGDFFNVMGFPVARVVRAIRG